jgi:hypothetical protein
MKATVAHIALACGLVLLGLAPAAGQQTQASGQLSTDGRVGHDA